MSILIKTVLLFLFVIKFFLQIMKRKSYIKILFIIKNSLLIIKNMKICTLLILVIQIELMNNIIKRKLLLSFDYNFFLI